MPVSTESKGMWSISSSLYDTTAGCGCSMKALTVPPKWYSKVCGCRRPCPCCLRECLHVDVLASLYAYRHLPDLGDALAGLRGGLAGRPAGQLEVRLGLHGQTSLLAVVCVEQHQEVRLCHVG